jgi:plasmid segregation protein ParM
LGQIGPQAINKTTIINKTFIAFRCTLCAIFWRAFIKRDNVHNVDVRAIDVGYFATKFTLGRRKSDGDLGLGIFPSLAPRITSQSNYATELTRQPKGVRVTVGNADYFVGPDAVTYSSGLEPRDVLTDYSYTDKYLALVRGALHCVSRAENHPAELIVESLVLGLPLNTYPSHKDALIQRVKGEHVFQSPNGNSYRVTTPDIRVIVQPQGGLLAFGARKNDVFKSNNWNLVIDAGGGTLDWFVSRGKLPNWARSGAHAKGMLACAYAVSDLINPMWRDKYEVVERIDAAIRQLKPTFQVGAKEYDLAQYAGVIEAIWAESTNRMLATLGGSIDDFDFVLFTGGGASACHAYMKKRFPHLASAMQLDDDPVYANVRGFHLAGELIARTQKRVG